MNTALVVVGLTLSFIYLVLGVILAVKYPSQGEMPKTRFGRFLFRIFIMIGWLPLVGVNVFGQALRWLFS